jgi:hypothetical protein
VRGSRNKLSEEVICALLRDFRKHGEKAIAKVRREQPGPRRTEDPPISKKTRRHIETSLAQAPRSETNT